MGTNYYIRWDEDSEPVHVGKQSYGWSFLFRVYDDGPSTPLEWIEILEAGKVDLIDEYDEPVSPERLLKIIEYNRGIPNPGNHPSCPPDSDGYRACGLEFS